MILLAEEDTASPKNQSKVQLLTLISYVLGNLKAIGLLIESASGGDIPFAGGVIATCLVMAF